MTPWHHGPGNLSMKGLTISKLLIFVAICSGVLDNLIMIATLFVLHHSPVDLPQS